ncbi:gluconate 2-dehydrogenase cytochrome c subunit precursor [Halomonas elongata]|uniref:Gluconate 2-dehydrogenase cytochrome c subunit n=1 Tax=Halomonas elongata TaxID=2746 RepID=A0A1B8NXS7_HALEL|nr:cytochrome c [Halomonas elongata]OBX34775.1 gluconate 2-dehydrogenase cytochrome c subunit precursor [Halomonas elongata]
MTHRIWLTALTGFGVLGAASVSIAAEQSLVQRGEYLARAGDCVACHTAPDGKPFAGGLEIESPFGTIVSTNITPDPDVGIGDYTRDEFAAALREGKRADGSNLYPAMPYPSYAKLSDADIDALYAYFMQEVEPVADESPESDVSFPFNQRWGISLWNWLFADAGVFEPSGQSTEQVERGAYLVQGLGHCGSCHTPRGLMFQEKALDDSDDSYLSGETLGAGGRPICAAAVMAMTGSRPGVPTTSWTTSRPVGIIMAQWWAR